MSINKLLKIWLSSSLNFVNNIPFVYLSHAVTAFVALCLLSLTKELHKSVLTGLSLDRFRAFRVQYDAALLHVCVLWRSSSVPLFIIIYIYCVILCNKEHVISCQIFRNSVGLYVSSVHKITRNFLMGVVLCFPMSWMWKA